MKILFISLGCDKNLVDSEEMLGLLGSRGYTCLLYTSVIINDHVVILLYAL